MCSVARVLGTRSAKRYATALRSLGLSLSRGRGNFGYTLAAYTLYAYIDP